MNVFSWSWKWKALFVGIGLISGGLSVAAFADDGNQACSSEGAPGVVEPQYDQYGRLTVIEDLAGRQKAMIRFNGDALDDIGQSRFIKDRAKPDRYGQTEEWGPTRWSEYNLKTGKLMVVHVYEKNRQLTYNIPADTDFEKLRDPQTGAVSFTGAPESCDVMYEDCKTLATRTIELTEPLAAAGGCLKFGGMSFALRRPQRTAEQDWKVDQGDDVKVVEQPAPEHTGGGSPDSGKSHKVCLSDDKSVCITVYDDDAESNPPSSVPAQ